MTENASTLARQEQAVIQAYQKRSADNFWEFVGGLNIQVGGKNRLFWSVAADFQKECFKALTPHIQALRDGDHPKKRRFWIERTKKASKDADLAAVVTWLCAFPKRPFLGEIGAADSDQASIIHSRVSALLEYNPWLLDYVELISSPYAIRSKIRRGSGQALAQVDILASDVTGGAHGTTPDLLILNELTHIKNRWDFVQACLANADGVPDGIVIVATNAGYLGTKAELMRNTAIQSSAWEAFIYNKPAPWHDETVLRDARQRDGESVYRRLWLGQWVSGKGDALNEDDIARCFTLKGPTKPDSKLQYVAGLDLGVSHDHSAYVILGIDEYKRQIHTAYWKSWAPLTKTGEVDLADVQHTIETMTREYRVRVNLYDPTEAKLMAQQLLQKGIPMLEWSFSKTSNLDKMASSLIQAAESSVLKCYDDPEGTLRRDFGKFTIEEKSYGYRLTAVRDEYGHADVGTALVIALPTAIEMMGGLTGELRPDDSLVLDDDTPLTDEEWENMDPGLRELIEGCDRWGEEYREEQALSELEDNYYDL